MDELHFLDLSDLDQSEASSLLHHLNYNDSSEYLQLPSYEEYSRFHHCLAQRQGKLQDGCALSTRDLPQPAPATASAPYYRHPVNTNTVIDSFSKQQLTKQAQTFNSLSTGGEPYDNTSLISVSRTRINLQNGQNFRTTNNFKEANTNNATTSLQPKHELTVPRNFTNENVDQHDRELPLSHTSRDNENKYSDSIYNNTTNEERTTTDVDGTEKYRKPSDEEPKASKQSFDYLTNQVSSLEVTNTNTGQTFEGDENKVNKSSKVNESYTSNGSSFNSEYPGCANDNVDSSEALEQRNISARMNGEVRSNNDYLLDKVNSASYAEATPAETSTNLWTPKKKETWADLFKASGSNSPSNSHTNSNSNSKPTSRMNGAASYGYASPFAKKSVTVASNEDPVIPQIGQILLNFSMNNRSMSLQPRGLKNLGNRCYVNACLQALLACPPLYHLLQSVPFSFVGKKDFSSTPVLDCLVKFVYEFVEWRPSKAERRGAKDISLVRSPAPDIPVGEPFEVADVFSILELFDKSSTNGGVAPGLECDAEEFLSMLLNSLHEELLAAKKAIAEENAKAIRAASDGAVDLQSDDGDISSSSGGRIMNGVNGGGDLEMDERAEDEWRKVSGKAGKSTVTREMDIGESPISQMFRGSLRSLVSRRPTVGHPGGSPPSTANIEPFYTLPLNIQDDRIRTVNDALDYTLCKESIDTTEKGDEQALRRTTMDDLPAVLILHLKRFVFDREKQGSKKLNKRVDFGINLEISKDALSSGVKSRFHAGQRNYRLFAVVYHHGDALEAGHYTSDIYHYGLNAWLRYNDTSVLSISQGQLIKGMYDQKVTPYLLLYRRCDLMYA